MPIFDNNGKKQNVQDAHVEKYMELYPDATTIMERDGKKYRVKAKDYNTFLGDTLRTAQETPKATDSPMVTAPQQDVLQTQTEMAAPVRQPKPESEYLGKIALETPNTPVEGDIYRGEYGTYTRTEVPYKTKEYASLEDAKAGRELNIEVSDEEALARMRKDGESRAAEPYAKRLKMSEPQEDAVRTAMAHAKEDLMPQYPYIVAEEVTDPLFKEFENRRGRSRAAESNEVVAQEKMRASLWFNPETGKTEMKEDAFVRADDLGLIDVYTREAKKRILADKEMKARAQENADALGMKLEDYVDAVAVPALQERMWNEWIVPQEEEARKNYNALGAMWDNSIIGMLDSHVGLFRPKPETDTDRYMKMVGQEEWSKNASLLERAGGFAGAMALDLPFFGGLGKLASVPAQYAGKQALKQMINNETKKMVARGVSEAAAKRYANYAVKNGLKNRIMLNLATAPLQSGLTFGMFDAGKAALNMSLNDEWSWGELGKSAAGGTLLGGALGVTGAVGGGLTHGLTGAAKYAGKVAEFGVENAVFTEGGRLIGMLHGQQPENGWLEDYVESAATLLMIKTPNIVKNIANIKGNKEASEVFAFNKLEREQLGKYGKDLNVVLESLLPRNENVAVEGKGVSLDGINEGRLTEEYVRVMNDAEIPMTTKAKLMAVVEGKAMMPPRVTDAKVEGKRVTTYDPMGRLVEVKEYATEAKADAEYKKLADKAEIESVGVLEDMYVRLKGYQADDATVREWFAKNPDVKTEEVAAIIAKDNVGEPLTKAEQKILDSLRKARREGLNDVVHLNEVLAGLEQKGINAKDVIAGIEKPASERTEAENKAVNAYREVLMNEVEYIFKAKKLVTEAEMREQRIRTAEDVERAAESVRRPQEGVKMLADRIQESDRQIDETANNGLVYTTTNHEGEKIIITSGKVVLDNEGYIDVNQSEGLVALMPDGTKKSVRVDELREKFEVSNAEELKAAKREEIKQEVAAENGWKVLEPGADIEIAFDGDVYKLKVEGRDERGDIILSGEGESMAIPESAVQEGIKEAERLRNAEVASPTAEEAATIEGGEAKAESSVVEAPVEQPGLSNEAQQPQAAATKVAEVPDFFRMDGKNYVVASRNEDGSVNVVVDGKRTILPAETDFSAAVPTDKRGEVLFTEMPAEKTLEYFVQRVPNGRARAQMIENNRKQAESALKKFDKEPNVGTDPDAYETTMNKWEADKTAAQAKVDYWNEVAKRDAQISQSEMRESVEAVKPREVVEMTPEEFVANQLSGIKITPESFQKETGTKAEQKQMVGTIAGKEKGGVSIERAAEIIYENYDDELRALGFNGDMQDVRDMIIDVLSYGNPRSFAKKGLEMRQQADVEQRLAELRDVANALNFESIEEQIAYEESIVPRIIQKYTGFDETEYFNNLAENYENDTTRESESTRGSSELLQGEQPADNAGVADLGEPGQGGNVQGDVYSGGENATPQGNQQVSDSEIPNNQSVAEGGSVPGQSGVAATLIKGAKWENTGEPDKIKSSRKKGDSHDITWYIGKKKYGSTTAERDLLVVLAEDYRGDLNAVWNAYEQGKVLLGANEAAILKKLIETNTSAVELQQGALELDRENPAFERATENVRKKLEATGVKVKVLTKEEAESELARLENAQRQVVNSRMSKLDKISRAIMNWLKNNTRNRRFEIELPEATQRKIRKEMGRDFNTHSITANEIAHSKKNHGVNGIKNTSNSIPLRDEDFALIPYIMTSPSYVERGSFSTDGSESIRFYKTLSNGYVVVVEKEQKNSPDDMATISMWAELSANVPNARNMRPSNSTSKPATVANNTGAGTVIISPDDVAKIRKDAENAILSDVKVEKMVYGGANSSQEVFVSNARKAVEEIKQEKATPQQWLAMIKKNVGLKAGEDKWMSLSEWLENNESKSLTKQEVLDFVNENAIKIEEVEYEANPNSFEALKEEYEDLVRNEGFDAAQDVMLERFGDDFSIAFDDLGGELVIANEDAAATLLGSGNIINSTRLDYTTEGLENKREIALVVPTVEPYNQSDEIHFGDAGNGRAVAWVRFGETTAPVKEYADFYAFQKQMQEKYYPERRVQSLNDADLIKLSIEEIREFERLRKAKEQIPFNQSKERVLVIDEIQSKRHQDGREKGYKSQADKTPATMEELTFGEYNGLTTVSLRGERFFFKSSTSKDKILDIINERIADGQLGAANSLVPDAPFERNWQELAMKRMLRLAAEEGFDKVAWTTGEQQAERYNLGNSVSSISVFADEYSPSLKVVDITIKDRMGNDASHLIVAVNEGGEIKNTYSNEIGADVSGKNLADVVGKEMANTILKSEVGTTISGDNLRIGGEGMKGFYDKMLPSFVSKYTKKWGAKVGTVEMPNLEQNNVMHSVDVTPEMKESVMEGQPMFLRTSDGTTYGWAVNGEIYLTPEGLNPNTPIHEYTHLWAAALQKSNPKLWGEVVEAMKLSPAWNEVMADDNYTDIHGDDNRVASEVLSRLSGNEGYRRYMELAEKEIAAERDIVGKVQKKGILNRIKNAVSRFWNWLKGKLGSKVKAGDSTEAKTEPWEVFVNKSLKDFDEGVNPDAKDSPLDRMFIGKKVDREGNVIGDGSSHVEYKVDEVALSYPNISYKVDKSATTESVYVTYYNNDPKYSFLERPKVTVRYSTHESNAVKFGDQLRGHMFDESTPTGKRLAERQTNILLTRLGLKKALPVYGKYIPNRQVSNKDIAQGVYEEADKTIQEMYDLPIGADISQYKGKVAKGSRYLIEGDEVMRGEVKDYKFVDAAEKEPTEGGIVENSANFVSTYKTEDGKDINYTSERAEGYGVQGYGTDSSNSGAGHSILQRQTDTGVPGANSGLNEDKGEFCVVERVFTENGVFNFTSGEKIESADDVAYIFSALEDAAKEHSFVVYVKDGKPTVIELGMGSFNATMVDIPTASLAYSRISPDHVYFVHNHPSGNLVCSDQDVAMLRVFEDMSDVPVTGVIINLKTGKYGTFDTERHSVIGEKRVPENEERLTVHTLDKQIFAPDYDPMAQPLVRSSQDVAQFLNSQRMGDRPKVSFLILSRANRIIGNIHTPFTDITTDTEAVARYINERVIQFGGENAILYGDFAISMDESRGFRLLQGAMERFGKTKLLDVVHVEGNFTKSAIDLGLLYEPEADYGVVKESEQGYGSTEQDIPLDEVESKPMTFAEKITNSVLEASAKNKDNLALRSDALRMYGRDVANVLKLMGKQREYDKSTVDQLVKLAKMYFKDAQLLGGLTTYQVGRVMTRLNSAVGKRDITDDANELVNILVDAHNKELDRMLEKQAKTKAKKVNASGVEVIGKLDKEGQLLLEEYNAGKELDLERIDEKIIDLQNEAAEGKAEEAAARIRGLELAREYREEILKKLDEIKGLEQELKDVEKDVKDGVMTKDAYKEFRRATKRAIIESKLEMVDAYHGLIHGLGGDISSSAKRAKLFQQQQIDHVKEIQHNANSDLLGHPADAQGETPDKWNSSVPRFFMSAMPTFQTMLKFFGEKAADGRGYLYERFIPQHTQASHNEYIGKTEAREKMRKKLTEIFGKKTSIEKFMDMSRKDGAVLEYQEGGQKKTIDLTRGQVLYLYMINKMADGQMKLSRMGITDADVQKMAKELPEEMVRFADWVQEEFLTELREKYNKVHERMFGAPMAAIESYFPIKINKRSRGEKIEPGMNAEDKPSTVTGSVIKRTKNAVAIDLNADAMQVLLGHIDDMENWAAWAEFRRDVKSLLNYRHFQNQVKGMESLRFGSGEKLWKNFVDVANIAAGSFKPSSTAADRAVRNIAKGVVSSKIAFRYFTALKQILSTPAFWSEVDFGKMINAYLHQKEAWDWAMKNLPGFSKRWEGRASGNEILLESDADWKVWQNRVVQWLSKEGMRANAFIDALTVATGAKAVFETKYEMFKKAGYSEARAREKALNRAAEAYNESQQSSESAYLSPLQAEATFVSSVLTAYRNSPFGYNRKMATAIANLKKKMKKGFKQESIEYMIKQLMRDGLNEEQAKKFAKSTYRRSVARDAADVALYEFFLNYVWVLGPSLIYILGGDDDEKKKDLNVEALIDGAMGGLGNLPAGETLTGAIKAIAEGDVSQFQLPQAVAMQDIETIADLMQTDPVRAAGEVLNILVAMGVGVNPQTFTDMFVALADVEDWTDPRELAMLASRLINSPNSKLELLEADEAMENYGENLEEITREYAEYQKSKRAPLTGWLYSDESEQKAIERYEKRFKKILDERFEVVVENTDEYDAFYENADPLMKAKLAKLRQKFLEGEETTMEKLDSLDVTKKVLFGSDYDEINTVYYGLSTAEDEDMAMMIDQKLKELTPMMDEYNKLRGDDRKAYREENLEQIQFYNKLNGRKNNVNNLKGAMKKKPEEAQEKMEKIRKIRTKAIDLINNYNE